MCLSFSGNFAGDDKSWRRFENYSTLVERLLSEGEILSIFFSWSSVFLTFKCYRPTPQQGFLKVPTQSGGGQDLVWTVISLKQLS